MHRTRGRIVLTVVFALLALTAWVEVALVSLGVSEDPAALLALESLAGATGTATAWGSWTGARWAPWAALSYGLTAGVDNPDARWRAGSR